MLQARLLLRHPACWRLLFLMAAMFAGTAMLSAQSISDLQAAVKRKDYAAQYQLGLCYLTGKGVSVDPKEAFVHLKSAADKGNIREAMHLVAVCYSTENGVKKNDRETFRYFEKAAAAGLADAQYKLGYCLEKGLLGSKPDKVKATGYYEEAAKQGHGRAQLALGRINTNYPEQFEWYRRASNSGIVEAQFLLAEMYSLGQGTPKDMIEAYKWYLIAARYGHETAMKRLTSINSSTTIKISAQQKAQAQAGASQYWSEIDTKRGLTSQ